MSEKVMLLRCCGCGLPIDVNGELLRQNGQKKGDGYFDNMRQVREAVKKHLRFCTNYTGEFRVTAEWYVWARGAW